MPIGVWTSGQTWAAPQTIAVWDGENWIRSKKLKVWNGSAWVLSWVHPVVNASLSLSKSSVSTGEAYNVTLTTPQLNGFPEGTTVTFRFTGYSLVMYPTEGSTSVTLTGASHAAAGTYSWYADVTNMGGTTTFGPVSQSAAVIGTTVTLTNPAWCLSTQSGSGGTASIAAATFTVTLSNPASAKWLSFQLSHAGGAWTEYKGWTNPTATSTHTMQFSTPGSWRARAIAVRTDDVYVYSAETTIYCYIKHLSMSLSPASPVVGQQISMTAAHSGDALGQTTGAWGYMRTSDYVWHDNWQTGNPSFWNPPTADDAYFRWVETYADGSTIRSNEGHSVVTSNEYVLNSGHCHDINAAMAAAKSQGKVLRLPGTYYSYTTMYIPDNLYINATGGMFYLNSTSAQPSAGFDSGRWKNDDKGNAAGYGQAGGFTLDGGTYDGNGDGCMTISHSPGFTVKNATFYRYCKTGNTGHAIETNSSGGTDNVNGPFTVQIVSNTFHGTDLGQRTNSNDEPCHYDWNWGSTAGSGKEDSGAAPPLWRPGEPVSTASQVMCHNVLIQGNTFHRHSEGGNYPGSINGGFAICAIGGHDSSDSAVVASYRHNHFLITGNAIHGAVGSTGVNPDKGAIHLFRVRGASVTNNALYGGVTLRYITAEDATDATYCSASGNGSANPALAGNDNIVVRNT